MARPPIVQPPIPASAPWFVLPDGTPLYPEQVVRTLVENIIRALFGGDGSKDVTQGISEGGVDLETGTTGDYVKTVTGDGTTITVTGGTGKGSNPLVSMTVSWTQTEKDKLAGIATGATANDTNANLRARASHTGTQAWSTITATPTTLAGYGITNAYTTAQVDTAVGGKVTKTTSIPAITTDMSGDAFANELKTTLNLVIAALNA